VKAYLGVESNFRPAKKPHPAFIVDDIKGLAKNLKDAGYKVVGVEPFLGYDRLYVDDPFGNRIELMEPKKG